MPTGSGSSAPWVRCASVVITVLAMGALATAQAQVAPSGLATVEGSSSNPFLFGRSNSVRIMDVYNAAELPTSFQLPRQLQGVVLRADKRNNTTTYGKKRNILMTFNVSTSQQTAESTLVEFEDFHGADRTSVFDGRLDVPLQLKPTQPAEPRPLNIVVPFDAPWFYDLSPVRGGAKSPSTLVLDYQVHDKVTSGAYELDMAGFCTATSTPFGRGANCLSSIGKQLQISANTRVYANGNLVYTVTDALPNNLVTLLLRVGPRSGFPGVALDNAQQCYLNLIPQLRQSLAADKSGIARFQYPIPRIGGLRGVPVHAQAFAYDINANSAEHVGSLGLTTPICGPYGVCQLMNLNQGSKATKAQSNVYGLAHVVGFR